MSKLQGGEIERLRLYEDTIILLHTFLRQKGSLTFAAEPRGDHQAHFGTEVIIGPPGKFAHEHIAADSAEKFATQLCSALARGLEQSPSWYDMTEPRKP